MPDTNKENWLDRLSILFILAGVIAAVVNVLHNRSLWIDEAMLSLNIINRTYSQLSQPLGLNQIAPIGFLWAEKFFSELFNQKDWALRIFPMLCFFCSIPLFFLLTRQLFSESRIAFYATALFAMNLSLLYYSFEVKQYAVDVLVTLLIMRSTWQYYISSKTKCFIILIIVGIISVWFSNIAVILLFSSVLFLTIQQLKSKSAINARFMVLVLSWLISFGLYYLMYLWKHPTEAYMKMYWSKKRAFMPHDFFSKDFFYFFVRKGKMIFTDLLYSGNLGIALLLFFFIGIVYLFDKRKLMLFLLLPICIHLFLSFLEIYPFDLRLVLYQIPMLTIIVVVGIFFIYQRFSLRYKFISVLFLLMPLLFFLSGLTASVPFEREEMKKVMNLVESNIKDQDNVYIYCSSDFAFKFYKKDYPNISEKAQIVNGGFHRENWNLHEQELSKLKGRSWLIFSQVYYLNGKNEEDYIIGMMLKHGFRQIQQFKPEGAHVYEFIR